MNDDGSGVGSTPGVGAATSIERDVVSRAALAGRQTDHQIVGWRVVDQDSLGLHPGLQVARVGLFFPFVRYPDDPEAPALVGNFTGGGLFGPGDMLSTMPSWFAIQRNLTRPFRLVADIRRTLESVPNPERFFNETVTGTSHFAKEASPFFSRGAGFAPPNWTLHWMRGAFLDGTQNLLLSSDLEACFRFVDATPAEVDDVSRLFAHLHQRTLMLYEAQRLIVAEPALSASDMAARLQTSLRSLQRRFAAEGLTLGDVRDRLRVEHAKRLVAGGEKLEVVAREVGFSSASHFRLWFDRHVGALDPVNPSRG